MPCTCWRSRPARSATSTASTASSSRRRCSTRAAGFGWPTSCSRPTSASCSNRSRRPRCIVAWQGGEPTLMGLDFFKRSIELRRALQATGPARRLHDPDQRHAAGRRVGRVLQDAQVSRRAEHRRAARAARRLSRGQGRPGHLRRRDARLASAAARTASTSTSCAPSTRPTATIRSRSTASSATSWRPSSSSSSPSSSG